MKKWLKRGAYVMLTASLLYVVWFYYTQPHFWKELDPAKPGFDVTKFRFEDYPSTKELKYVLETLFPEGSSAEEFENFLLQDGFSKSERLKSIDDDGKVYDRKFIGGSINSLRKFFFIHYPQVNIILARQNNTLLYAYLSGFGSPQYLYDKGYKYIFEYKFINKE